VYWTVSKKRWKHLPSGPSASTFCHSQHTWINVLSAGKMVHYLNKCHYSNYQSRETWTNICTDFSYLILVLLVANIGTHTLASNQLIFCVSPIRFLKMSLLKHLEVSMMKSALVFLAHAPVHMKVTLQKSVVWQGWQTNLSLLYGKGGNYNDTAATISTTDQHIMYRVLWTWQNTHTQPHASHCRSAFRLKLWTSLKISLFQYN
jgi:hypothetical protein